MLKFAEKNSRVGQTIIEVLIAVAVVGVVLTAVASALTQSVKNTVESKYKSVATNRAQEVLEIFRRERFNLGWESFQVALSDGAYCYNSLPTTSQEFVDSATGTCVDGEIVSGVSMKREVTITSPTSVELQVEVAVSWTDGDIERDVTINQTFRRWE